jgi:HEAT repeat protein/YHS domain-containing protein
MMHCPVCGKSVDPLRAPAVSVRDGKVVPFCSQECRAQSETQPVKLIPTKIVRLPADVRTPAGGFRTPSSGIPTGEGSPIESGPVIEVVRGESTPVKIESGPTKKKRADSSAVQIADTGHVDDYVTSDEPRRGPWVAIAIMLALGGAGGALYLLVLRKPAPAKVEAPIIRDAGVVKPVDATPALTPAAALDRAKAVLVTQEKSDSPRVQRVAASALARTGDKASLDLLAAAMKNETSEIAKLDIAYALARSNDKRGSDALVAALNGPKRDPKLEAGRRLALLGDKRAVHVLTEYLDVSQLRLGTAEQLAYLADQNAMKVLDGFVADPKSLPDEKARAQIALGHAGRTDVTPALRALLTDDRQNSFAAQALAVLHDEAARPVLVSQLAIPSLRVKSARALRRLDPEANVSALLPPLVAALESNKDTEQVQLAEAILLLAGPAAWSEHE